MTDSITERIRRRHDDIPQDGLFDIDQKRSEEPTQKAAKPKVVAHVKCPICQQEKVRVIRVAGEDFRPRLIFDTHYRTTMRGHRFPCAGTGMEAEQ